MSDKGSWPIAGLHHGHKKMILGCNDCYAIAHGWVCLCGCPNSKWDHTCKSCGEGDDITRQRCRSEDCKHGRKHHERLTGPCKCGGCDFFVGPDRDPKKRGA